MSALMRESIKFCNCFGDNLPYEGPSVAGLPFRTQLLISSKFPIAPAIPLSAWKLKPPSNSIGLPLDLLQESLTCTFGTFGVSSKSKSPSHAESSWSSCYQLALTPTQTPHQRQEDRGGPSDPATLEPLAGRRLRHDNTTIDQPPDFAKQAPRFSTHGALDTKAPIHRLPTETILEIASYTTPCSRACLTLSSKRLFCVISDGFDDLFNGLRLPAETPHNYCTHALAKDWPLMHQPERWRFLCLLQKDSRQWLACSDWFVLHPAQWFGQTDCRVASQAELASVQASMLGHLPRNKIPRGIVDLCPCTQLTQGKKGVLLSYLRRRHGEQERQGFKGVGSSAPPTTGPWWHECHKAYDSGVIGIKLHPHLLENGDLGVKTAYTFSRYPGAIFQCTRLGCPHLDVEGWKCDVMWHMFSHSFNDPCLECLQNRQCRYCPTRVGQATRGRRLDDGGYFSTLSTVRILSDKYWVHQIVFPFPRYTKVLYPSSPQVPPHRLNR